MNPNLHSGAHPRWLLATLASLMLAAGLSGCGEEQKAQAAAAPQPQGAPVSVAAVIARAVQQEREFSGQIEAIERAQLRPRVSGYIDSVRFQPGSLVKKGDVLFVIDPRPYQTEVARLEAAAASARVRAEQAGSELARAKRLLADNAIAQREHDERAATARQLDAAARADTAALQTAKLNLEWTQVRAPFSGRVGKAEVTTGNLVDGNTVLTSLVSANPMYVSFNGDEATYLQLGQRARSKPSELKIRVGLANETGFPHTGRLEFVDNQIDPQSGSVRLRAVVDNTDGLLTPGLFAKVQLATGSSDGALQTLVLERAIGTDQNRKFVVVVGPNNMGEQRPVQLGSTVGDLRVVTSGLKVGEKVVVDGLQRVRPGAPLAPTEVPMAPAQAAASSASAAAAQ
jgi:multidrug efflux system membrane fusion protein